MPDHKIHRASRKAMIRNHAVHVKPLLYFPVNVDLALIKQQNLRIAVIGSGISGLSAAWLLSRKYTVDLFEKDDRLGGHSNTVATPDGPVDTGFIVYNEPSYPDLSAFLDYLDVETCESDMSFAVSLDRGTFEYAGRDLAGLIAQKSNLLRLDFWRMTQDILRFYRQAPLDVGRSETEPMTLGEYLNAKGYSRAFIDLHLIPMGAAIWSTPASKMLDYPLFSFVRFCENHGLLRLAGRPQWRTVKGGSQSYVEQVARSLVGGIRLNSPVRAVRRTGDGVVVETHLGQRARYDHVVLACHADQALAMLAAPTRDEESTLSCFRYERNRAILHTDESLMPKRRNAWCSWNYLAERSADQPGLCVSYWMNSLQPLHADTNYFVTLNPIREPKAGRIVRSFLYDHPVYDLAARDAQEKLWSIQGHDRLWYCGSYFGYGFHEDGIQSGLAVAEALSGTKRPWTVRPEGDRIGLPADWPIRAKSSDLGQESAA